MKETSATETVQTAFRLDPDLIARIDSYAARMSVTHGIPATRSDVVRLLLTQGLDRIEARKARKS